MNSNHKPGKMSVISLNNPMIAVVDDMLPEEAVDQLIEDIENFVEFKPASVVGKDGKSIKHYARNNQSGNTIDYSQSKAAQLFLQAASSVLRLHPSQAEALSIIKYDLGQKYDPHHDTFADENMASHKPEAGNRVATALLYLSDVIEGGATVFPRLDRFITPKKGRCIFFSTTHMGTDRRLEASLHGAEPVVRGEKMAVNLWFRQNVYSEELYQKIEGKPWDGYK